MDKQTGTLGQRLNALRLARGMSTRHMALSLGASLVTYQRWQGDADLPDAEGLLRVCHALQEPPIRVMPMVRATACQILREAMAAMAGMSQPMAARERGPVGEADEASCAVANLPSPLRRGLARWADVDGADAQAVEEVLRRLSAESPYRQQVVVEGLVAGLELDGEDAWGLPPLEL